MGRRALARLAFAILLLAGGLPPTAKARDLPGDYFPDGTFSHFETEEWYGPYLHAMDTPSLFRLAKKSHARVYRVTSLPPFGACLSLTLYVQPDGTGRLELSKVAQITTTANEGGYTTGPILRRAAFVLKPDGVRRFERLLDDIHFWRLPLTRPSTITDANTFLYEAACDGRYHVVEVTDPGFSALLPPARFLLGLAGEKMPN